MPSSTQWPSSQHVEKASQEAPPLHSLFGTMGARVGAVVDKSLNYHLGSEAIPTPIGKRPIFSGEPKERLFAKTEREEVEDLVKRGEQARVAYEQARRAQEKAEAQARQREASARERELRQKNAGNKNQLLSWCVRLFPHPFQLPLPSNMRLHTPQVNAIPMTSRRCISDLRPEQFVHDVSDVWKKVTNQN